MPSASLPLMTPHEWASTMKSSSSSARSNASLAIRTSERIRSGSCCFWSISMSIALYTAVCDCSMHLDISTVSTLLSRPKYLTKACWLAICARMKDVRIVVFCICSATSAEMCEPKSLALTILQNFTRRKSRTIRIIRKICAIRTSRASEELTALAPLAELGSASTIMFTTNPKSPISTKQKSKTFQPSVKYFSFWSANFSMNSHVNTLLKAMSEISQPKPPLSSSSRTACST
mmetsp:Transcript_23210/g.44563  ORF Transcript_23210/g.44563 Transcript_23210/m.44563 type:complete len:233 (-) Transcript_23210:522-1220(-)